jgi:hypothetical protein
MHLLASARPPMAGLMALVDREKRPDAINADAAEHLLSVVRTYLK